MSTNPRLKIEGWKREDWIAALSRFPDRSLYQTWDYGELHSPGRHRQVLRAGWMDGDEPRVLAQMRLKRLPLLGTGVAELEWGPLHRSVEELEIFLKALRTEAVENRGIELRVHPKSTYTEEQDRTLVRAVEAAGFVHQREERPYRTVALDLSPDVDTLLANLQGSWRRQLRKAQSSGLVLEEGDSVEYFDRFSRVYAEMWGSKQFITGVRHPIVRELVETLPKGEKFRITLAVLEGRDVGASVCSEIGDTTLYYLGASSPGLRGDCAPGHLLHWNNVQRAKERGFAWYDLGGIVDTGEGVNRFKRGMGGIELVFPGCFSAGGDRSATKVHHWVEDAFRGLRRLVRRR